MQCDRTGPTQIVGTVLCPGIHDYIALVNSKGGVEGHKIKALEIDHEYKVPPAVESYERHKKEGAVTIAVYGTPQIYALTAKLTEDRIPGTSPGFGSAAAADGKRYPVHLPHRRDLLVAGAPRRSTSSRSSSGGSLKGKKIAYLFYDNPAGREPHRGPRGPRGSRRASSSRPSPCRRPAWRWAPRCSTSPSATAPDFVIAHLFGGAPAVSIKELKRLGLSADEGHRRWCGRSAEADIEAAGGFGVAEGYYTMQFAGVGNDYPVLNEIREMYKKQGKPAPKEMASTVFYNRGVLSRRACTSRRSATRSRPSRTARSPAWT